ncbi:toll-like receptor 13 [Liolophura sinensis]|uniref:toll-like receptor 13 n=1 Tax=Liolophura sinensis TaxID=3198878 RepID=UPI0031592C95
MTTTSEIDSHVDTGIVDANHGSVGKTRTNRLVNAQAGLTLADTGDQEFLSSLHITRMKQGVSDDHLQSGFDQKPADSSTTTNLDDSCPLSAFCKCTKSRREMKCTGNIPYIPVPPAYVTSVTVLRASFGTLTKQTLTNVTNVSLSCLNLTHSEITHIEKDVFLGLKFCQGAKLDLSGNNRIYLRGLKMAFCDLASSNVSVLQLDNMNFKTFPSGLLDCLLGSKIRSLSLRKNNFLTFSGQALSPLGELTTLTLTYNNIAFLQDVEGFRNLTILGLRWNNFTKIPRLFKKTSPDDSVYPKLQMLRLGYNRILEIAKEDFSGLRNLKYLELKFNYIRRLANNLFRETPKLERLHLKHNNIRQISRFAFNRFSLRYLELSVNAFHFSTADTKNFFKLCPNLDGLYLTDNIMDINSTALEELFSPLSKLTRLIIENMRIYKRLLETLFRVLPSLRELIASSNSISDWTPGLFTEAKKLEKLYMDSNKISTISEYSFPKSLLANLKKLNLARNPFACNCDLMWFRNWIRTTNVTIVVLNHKGYKCYSPKEWKHKNLLSFNPTVESCTVKKLNLPLILGASLGTAAVVIAITVTVFVRYRMHISYCCFLTRSKLKGYTEIEDSEGYDYDAFVVYSATDRNWVIQELLARVEDEEGFKLCLYDRDFIPGTDIVDNIMVSMEASRKVILVLSDSFAASEWCEWELKMAQHKLLDERREILILVKLGDIQHRNMTNRLMLLMRDKIYIDWSNCELSRHMFWQKLIRALSRPSEPTAA